MHEAEPKQIESGHIPRPGHSTDLALLGLHTASIDGKNTYDVHQLFDEAEGLPITSTSLSTFEARKTDKCWVDSEGNELGPGDLLTSIEKYRDESGIDWEAVQNEHPVWTEHLQKVREANYDQYPILTVGRDYAVIDGMHRLTKAWLDNASDINVKQFDTLPDSALIPPEREQFNEELQRITHDILRRLPSQEMGREYFVVQKLIQEMIPYQDWVVNFLHRRGELPEGLSRDARDLLTELNEEVGTDRPRFRKFAIQTIAQAIREAALK